MIHLHVHTMYSLLDSNIKLDELFARLKELGQDTIAITDHGYMYGCVEFYKKAKENRIKPIIGCECYICDDATIKNKESTTNHIVLLAKNEIGRLNLQKLVKESTLYKYRGKPRIDWNMLVKYHEGLICLSACMAGELSRSITQKKVFQAKQIAMKYKELFKDDYYIEYQSHANNEQLQLNKILIDIANSLDIKYVVTCDVHYLTPQDQKYHSIFVQIGQSREVGETYTDCHLQTEEEIKSKCTTTLEYNDIAIENTHEIANKCTAEYPLSAPIIPHVLIPTPFKDEESYLKHLCNQGFKDKKINLKSKEKQVEYKKRAKYELDAVLKMGFEGYYLLVHSYIASVERRGIGRGSAGGSLLAYLMGITDLDPIEYGLYFERFIDVGALDLLESGQITKKELKIPDVDTDFSKRDRNKAMQFIIDKYGEKNVVCLGQFTYIWAKGAIKDIGKVLDIPFAITNKMTKNLNDETIDEALDLGLLDEYKLEYPELFEYASKLAGLPKSFGVHPCGRCISMTEAVYYNALSYDDKKDVWILQGDMQTADDLGLVKIDLLGLRTLDVIYDVLEMVGKTYDDVAPHNIDFNDKLVWNEFQNGNTNLIFQFESDGMKKTLRDMKCDNINDLSVANALYRPGSMKYISNYVNRKHGREEITYLHDDLKSILSVTYGIIVFQEQLIEIGRLANLKNPDELRQATAKKKPKLMAKIEPEMKNRLMKRGWSQEQVNKLWEDILDFAKYSFNKSHSQAYALTAYISMYLKVHYPVEYICAYINSYDGKVKEIAKVLIEARRMGVKFGFDNWRKILPTSTVGNGEILLGIKTLKGFGSSVSDTLIECGKQEYNNFVDLIKSLLSHSGIDTSQFEKLIQLDIFNEYGKSGKLLQLNYLYNSVYTRKVFDKSNLPIDEKILKKYARATDKQYRDIDTEGLFNELSCSIEDKNIPLRQQLTLMFELQGVVNYVQPSLVSYYFVTDVDVKYSPKIIAYCLDSGKTELYKIGKKIYNINPIEVGDIIKIENTSKKNKSIWNDEKQEWDKIENEFDIWINKYVVK